MKIPATPPDITFQLGRTTPERLAEIIRATSMLVAGRYLHWDNVRHREPPEGLSHQEWWLGTRISRLSARETVPFRSKEGNPFSLVHAAPVRQGLHEIDRKLGMSGPRSEVRDLVEGHGRKHLLANSIVEEAIRSSQLEGASTTRRHMANSDRKRGCAQEECGCPRLLHRPRLPPPPHQRPPRHPPRISHRPTLRAPPGPPPPPIRQHRPRRPRPSRHRPRHGHIHPLRGVLHRPDLGPAIAGAAALPQGPPRKPHAWLSRAAKSRQGGSSDRSHIAPHPFPRASPRP